MDTVCDFGHVLSGLMALRLNTQTGMPPRRHSSPSASLERITIKLSVAIDRAKAGSRLAQALGLSSGCMASAAVQALRLRQATALL